MWACAPTGAGEGFKMVELSKTGRGWPCFPGVFAKEEKNLYLLQKKLDIHGSV
jgi:hypothetical protein